MQGEVTGAIKNKRGRNNTLDVAPAPRVPSLQVLLSMGDASAFYWGICKTKASGSVSHAQVAGISRIGRGGRITHPSEMKVFQ